MRTYRIPSLEVRVSFDLSVGLSKQEHECMKVAPSLTHRSPLKINQAVRITYQTILNVVPPLVCNDSIIKCGIFECAVGQ